MNRHARAALWRLTDRMRPAAVPVFAALCGVMLGVVPALHT